MGFKPASFALKLYSIPTAPFCRMTTAILELLYNATFKLFITSVYRIDECNTMKKFKTRHIDTCRKIFGYLEVLVYLLSKELKKVIFISIFILNSKRFKKFLN